MKAYNSEYKCVATPTKIGLSRSEAAIYIGIGVTKFDELVAKGLMPQSRSIGTRKIWVRPELDSSLISLPSNDNEAPNSWDGIL